MAEAAERDRVRAIIGTPLSDEEADALIVTSTMLSRALAQVSHAELRAVEPALLSVPNPRQSRRDPGAQKL